MSRPKGAKNLHPSQEEQRQMLKMLADRARAGDALSAGLVLLIASVRERENRHAA